MGEGLLNSSGYSDYNNNGSIQNQNDNGPSHDNSNILNTSFGADVKKAANENDECLSYSDGILKYYYKRGSKDQLFLIDEQKGNIYVFRREDIHGIAKIVRLDIREQCYSLEIREGLKPYLWTTEKHSSTWPYASINDAHQAFNEKLQVQIPNVRIPLSYFKKMLMHFFSKDYQKFLEKEALINSVLYDENGRLRNTTTIDFDTINFDNKRYARLFFVQNGTIYSFSGESIKGVAAVVKRVPGKAKPDTKYINSNYKITIPEGVTFFIMPIDTRNTTWPEHDLQTAHEKFESSYGIKVSDKKFCEFLENYFSGFYKRIVREQELIEKLTEQSGSQIHIVPIKTKKAEDDRPHSDIRVIAPDGRKWTISYTARPGTNIDGVCTIISSRHYENSIDDFYTHLIAAAEGVKIYIKQYKKGSKYPSHFFIKSNIHKEMDTSPHKKSEQGETQDSEQDPKTDEEINHQ